MEISEGAISQVFLPNSSVQIGTTGGKLRSQKIGTLSFELSVDQL